MKDPGFFKKLLFAFNQSAFDKYKADFLAGNDVSNPSVSFSEQTGMAFSAVFACFRVLAETFASVPVFEFKKLDNGDRDKTDDTGFFNIFHGIANEEMSSYNFKEMSMYQLCSGGNAISFKKYNALGGAMALDPVEWQRIRIDREKDTGKLFYLVDGTKKYYREDVFHVPGPSTNGVVGMSILEYASQAIRLGLSYEKFGNKFYENSAMPSGVFEHPGNLNDEAFDRLRDGLKKEYSGLMNAGTPMLLEDGLKYNQLTMKLVDAEFLSSKKYQVEDICRFCRVPLHLVQNLDRATNNNIEHQSLEFIMYTMLPHFKRYEECINTQLLSPRHRRQGYYFEFDINAMLRGDLKSRYEAYGIGRQWGFLSANDILRLENKNGIGQKGDIYLQPSNMIEAGKEPVQQKQISSEVQKEIEDLLKLPARV